MMNDPCAARRRTVRPFLLRFGEPIMQNPGAPLIYDPQRQIVRALVGGRWLDAADLSAKMLGPGTRITRVERETTDDE